MKQILVNVLMCYIAESDVHYVGGIHVGAPGTYHCTFPAMIDDWREKWYASTMQQTDELFGFGFVQVCSVQYDVLTHTIAKPHPLR